jgi:hypothetical protein
MFPLSDQDKLGKSVGTRHRAAVGLSDETDAVVIVVSEENGVISVSHEGRLIRNLDENHLRNLLSHLLSQERDAKFRPSRIRSQAHRIISRLRWGRGETAPAVDREQR